MSAKSKPAKQKVEMKVSVTRVVKAPCQLVYQAWTDPKQLAQWFSPEDAKCQSVAADVRVGGAHRIHLISQKDNRDHIAVGEYKQVIPNQLLQFTWHWEHYHMPDSVITVSFEDLGKTTRVTLVHEGLPDQEDVEQHGQGWTSLMKKFARLMAENKIKAR
jgi:uncharacterized protein YndB with AHSA1/START domain